MPGAAFGNSLRESQNPSAFAVLTLLAWLAHCDGTVSPEERNRLRQLAASSDCGDNWEEALDHAAKGDTETLLTALSHAARLESQQRRLLLELALHLALADSVLTTSEIHILLLLADALAISVVDLDAIFREATGEPFPKPSDLSDPAWWAGRGQRKERNQENGSTNQSDGSECSWAFATLGLETGESTTAIREAYRRLAKVHHPDRFASLGDDAVKAATISFQRIQKAYVILGSP